MKTKPETFSKSASRSAVAAFATATLALVIAAATKTVHAAATISETLLTQDFSTFTAGAAPTNGNGVIVKYPTRPDGGTAGAPNRTLVLTTDAASTPTDPFGGSGNKSGYLWWHTQSSAGKHPVLQFDIPGYTAAPLTTGTLTFDFYMPTPVDGTGIMEIDISSTSSNADSVRGATSLVAVQVQGSTTDGYGTLMLFTDGQTGGATAKATTSTVTFNAKHTLAISWDVSSKTYSLKLDDVTVEGNVGGSLVSSFGLTQDLAGAAAVRFTTASGGNNTSVGYFVDNILVTREVTAPIPEPTTTAAVLGVIAAAIAAAATRFARKSVARSFSPRDDA